MTPAERGALPDPEREERFSDRLLMVAGLAVVLLLAWKLANAFTILFGGLVLATVLDTLSSRLQQWTGIGRRWSVGLVLLLILILLVAGGWLIGDRMVQQLGKLQEQVPTAVDAVTRWMDTHPLGLQVRDWWETAKEGEFPWARLGTAAGLTIGLLGNTLLMVVLGVYLALDPRPYRRGLVRLVPQRHRDTVREAVSAAGEGLSRWLVGQSISMLFVGSSVAIGLWLLDMPLALSLGLISGVFAFVPFFGPIASGFLAVLLAFIEGPTQALYVALLYLLIEQFEGSVIMPFVQRWAVALPPVLGLLSVVVFGVLFGPVGVVFATPMMVILVILVQRIYVEGVLGDEMETKE